MNKSEIMIKFIQFVCCFVRAVLTITRPYSDKVLGWIYNLILAPSKKLPPITDKILLMSATELAKNIRKRKLTSEQVVKAYVSRCKLIQPFINAIVDERYEDALRNAQTIDRMLASEDKSEDEITRDTPLLGVPFTCKEALGVKGMTQTAGLVRARGHVAPEDSDAAALYKRAGAIPLTVTNVPELCLWWESSNHLFGRTLNPYNNFRIPGGSTGGEAALLTSAGAVIGIGTDMGGSIRLPSSFCGIYGHKPTQNLVSNWGIFPHSSPDHIVTENSFQFSTTGPMCRYAQDIPLLMKILSDNDSRINLDSKVDFRKVNIYYMEQIPGLLNSATPDIKNAVKKAVKYFEDQFGVKPVLLTIDELKYSFQMWQCKFVEYESTSLKKLLAGDKNHLNIWWELFKNCFGYSKFSTPLLYFALTEKTEKDVSFKECMEKFETLQEKFQDIFLEDAVLLIPTHPEPAPYLFTTIPKIPNVAYTCIFNILGFPSTNIPVGLSQGVPFGIQAVSGAFKDHLTIAAAVELDKYFNGWNSPSTIDL